MRNPSVHPPPDTGASPGPAGVAVAGYRIEALIGRGGMGAVYRAEEEALSREVALKVIAPELARDERFRERFLRESQIAASLDHPNVVPIYRAGEDDGVLYLAMRYVEGADLAKLLAAEGALEPRRALDLVSQVAEALDAAHEKGLVHRDVKPSNVLVGSVAGKEHCYLGDFGLTRRTGPPSEAPAGDVVGTLEYLAPEQATGGGLDERADVYSLGCVLYECLTGQPPFPRATDVALLWAHVHEEPIPPSTARPGLPRELDPVLARALAKEPEARYASAGELAGEARSALAHAETPRFEQIRSHGLLVGAASVVLIAAAVLLILALRDPAPVRLAANTVGVIDAETNELVSAVTVGREPRAIADGEEAVWVVNSGDGTVMRIDPVSKRVVATVPVARAGDQVSLGGIAADDEAAWVVRVTGGELAVDRISSAYDTISATARLGRTSWRVGDPRPVAAGDGAVWTTAAAPGTVLRLDPVTLHRTGTYESTLAILDLAVEPGVVWLATRTSVAPLYPDRSEPPARIPVGSFFEEPRSPLPHAIAVGEGAAWATLPEEDALARVDLATHAVATIPVGKGPVDVTVGADAVWVANAGDGTISRIDPETRQVVAVIDLDAVPAAIAARGPSLWVAIASPGERSVSP